MCPQREESRLKLAFLLEETGFNLLGPHETGVLREERTEETGGLSSLRYRGGGGWLNGRPSCSAEEHPATWSSCVPEDAGLHPHAHLTLGHSSALSTCGQPHQVMLCWQEQLTARSAESPPLLPCPPELCRRQQVVGVALSGSLPSTSCVLSLQAAASPWSLCLPCGRAPVCPIHQ